MSPRRPSASWAAFAMFYFILLVVTIILDYANGLLTFSYLIGQVGMITLGVGVFAVVGWRFPEIKPQQSVLLAFTIGVLTIVPAVLMSLGEMPGFWSQYFLVALGMVGGAFLGFLFVKLVKRLPEDTDNPLDGESGDNQ